MGTIHIKEMTGGLDARRLPETTPGGVLIRADNGHITRGGEFETRAAFVKEFDLPAGTVGLAQTESGLLVFGSGTRPGALSPFIRYQRLQSGSKTLARIRDWELFSGKIYAIAEFTDGAIAHFYNGVEVPTWQDARATVQLRVESGSVTPSQQATAQFTVTGGAGEVINTVTSIRVSGTEILGTPLVHTGDNATTAAAIAARINANPTTPRYLAAAAGSVVTLTAERPGTAANGRTITFQTTGNFALGAATTFSGGVNEIVPRLLTLSIGGVRALRQAVTWPGSAAAMAEAIAEGINDLSSNPEYSAIARDGTVFIHTNEAGTAQNGRTLTFTTSGTISLSTPAGTDTAGGAELGATNFLPADVVLTVREKLYAGSGTNLHYSAIQGPTYWQAGGTGAGQIGAGFTNVADSNSSPDRITALARYFDKLAVFTGDTVQTWFLDPDPDLVVQSQVLENTGTDCPRSVTQFGDADIFYLDTSGLRSLRARDSSNAAASTDIGVPIDDILSAKLAAMSASQRQRVVGLINPSDKRFWLVMGREIFVYSYYPNSKVNAWTRYEAASTIGTVRTEFDIEDAISFDRRVFLRAGNAIYCYGGWSGDVAYDATPAVAWLPMLDADAPTAEKDWRGVDAAITGNWTVGVSFDPNQPETQDDIANLTETTYGLRRIAMKGRSTHVGLRFVSRGGPAKLSALVIHFEGKVNED
ncbi:MULTISPECIES: hypothetical protein [Paracoccus]|uniref:hypothetical protein n=1 Tax=Paracoccus TaxID=265 RepID=UPI00086BFB6E|nr:MULTISPECIES: hypothetical protein [Paracoccus]ODT60957.1 MAG: hypothetical protein ABS73_03725 [Paracoccus sp. SCN 68-21]